MEWFRAAPIAALVPRLLGTEILYDSDDYPGAPDHFEVEGNILNTRPPGKWPRLTVTLFDVRLVSTTMPAPGDLPEIDAVEVDVLLSVSNPDAVWTDQHNESSRRLLGYAIGYLHAHPKKSWALNGDGGGPNVVIDWDVQRLPMEPALVNGFFVAARVPLMPAVAYRVRVTQVAPLKLNPNWPGDWGLSKVALLTGAGSRAAAEEYAASNKRPLVWADELAGDPAALDALAAAGHILAFHELALAPGGKVDRVRVDALPAGSVVLGRDPKLSSALKRAGLPVVER